MMKAAVFSDTHSNTALMVEAVARCRPDLIIHLGDHSRDTAILREKFPEIPLYSVRGNCDTEVDQMVLEFPILADYAVLTAGQRLIYATHGHRYNTAHLPPLQPGDILLHGHTHIPAWEQFGRDNLYLNPGSVSIPKENSPRSYMTLQDGVLAWKDLDGAAYHTLHL